jgi:hypothetical protein
MLTWALTDRVHGMRSELKHAVEYERTTLEKAVAPVPAIVFDDMVCLRLDPEIERD